MTAIVSTLVYDTLWSLHLGKPRTLAILGSDCVPIQSCVSERVLRIWMELCVNIAQVCDFLNPHTSLGLKSITQLLDIDVQIQQAYDALPPDLVNHNRSITELDAAAYAYHMQFYSTKIIIHRALIWSSVSDDAHFGTGVFQYNPDSSWSTMYENAICITELTLIYREIFGLD